MQPEIGKTFAKVFKEGKVHRKDVWITSKLWNAHHKPEEVARACRQTLKDLQLEYLDLYLIHWPVTAGDKMMDPPIQDTWEAMEKLVDEGLVKSIGVSNFSCKKLGDLLKVARIKPAVDQVELHPYFRNDQLQSFCKEKGVHITAYSPLGSPDSMADSYKNPKELPHILDDKQLQEIAKELGVSKQAVLIRWNINMGNSAIPKASSKAHIEDNFKPVLDLALKDHHMHKLSTYKFQMRVLDGTGAGAFPPAGPYTTLQDLWDGEVPEENQKIFEAEHKFKK
eukprot:jgi/Astpho2/5337/Aster-05888